MFLLLVAGIIIDSTTSLNIRDGVLYNFLCDFTSELYYFQYPEDVDLSKLVSFTNQENGECRMNKIVKINKDIRSTDRHVLLINK